VNPCKAPNNSFRQEERFGQWSQNVDEEKHYFIKCKEKRKKRLRDKEKKKGQI